MDNRTEVTARIDRKASEYIDDMIKESIRSVINERGSTLRNQIHETVAAYLTEEQIQKWADAIKKG